MSEAAALGAFAYPMALAALPRVRAFDQAAPPLVSRLTLDRRLALLPAQDRAEIAAIEALLTPAGRARFASDAEFLGAASATLSALRASDVRAIVEDQLSLVSILAALLRKAAGGKAPARGEVWGLTPRADSIRLRWREPGFGLRASEDWVGAAEAALQAGEPRALERAVVAEAFRRLRLAEHVCADGFAAIVVYVLQWSLAWRWAQQNPAKALRRFETWIADVLDAAPAESAA